MELRLELEVTSAVEITAGGGQRFNALFLDLVREADPSMSSRLHDMRAPKPYTVSPLMGEMESLSGGRLRLSAGRPYALRFTMLDDDLVGLWEEGLLPGLRGRHLRLGDADFTVAEVRKTVTDADDLYRACIVNRKAPPRKLILRFVSPTAFRSGGYNVLFPIPRLVWQSANRAWSAVSRVDLGDNLHLLAEEGVKPARFNLSTHILHFDRSRQVGVVGRCEYMLGADDEDLCRAFHLLARFCEYSGLGMKTTMGMGQVRFGDGRNGRGT
jgi:CRISPR-associated endoribonuclease Cas6